MAKLVFSVRRDRGLAVGVLVCAYLATASGCRPAEGGSALEARPGSPADAVPKDLNLKLKETTFQALKTGSCVDQLVAFPANPRAIPVSIDPTTGKTSPLPFLEGESFYYLPKEFLGQAAAQETNTMRICFDNVRQIAQVTSSETADPSDLRLLRICGTEPRAQQSDAAGPAVILSEPQTCETVVAQRQ